MLDPTTLVTVAGAVAGTALTVLGGIWVARSRAKIDVSSAITTGFQGLTDQLQEQHELDVKEVRALRAENAVQQTQIDECQRLCRMMRRHIEELEGLMQRAGIIVPERPSKLQ